LFRPTRSLDPAEAARRNDAARAWALARRDDGSLRTASPLEDEGVRVSRDDLRSLDRFGTVAAVLVIEAEDIAAAVALARTHPGLAYGVEIDVRPVKQVALPAA
jgi:hypothetical protein